MECYKLFNLKIKKETNSRVKLLRSDDNYYFEANQTSKIAEYKNFILLISVTEIGYFLFGSLK